MTAIYDAGAFLALERHDRELWSLFKATKRREQPPATHGGVVGQVWRGGARQARLAVALKSTLVVALDDAMGRRAGELLAASGTADVIDAGVALLASDGDAIYTSDPDDLAHLVATLGRDVEIILV